MSSVTKSFVRARLNWVGAEDKNDILDHQITVDIIIDQQSRMPVGQVPLFGLYGSPVRPANYPFVLHNDGTVDFGDCAEVQERLQKFNIRQRRIEIGELATYDGDEGEAAYRIVAVEDLTA